MLLLLLLLLLTPHPLKEPLRARRRSHCCRRVAEVVLQRQLLRLRLRLQTPAAVAVYPPLIAQREYERRHTRAEHQYDHGDDAKDHSTLTIILIKNDISTFICIEIIVFTNGMYYS